MFPSIPSWEWALCSHDSRATSGAEGDAHLHAALAAKDAELAKARDDHARELQRVQADFEARMRAAGYDSSAAARGGDAEARPNASVLPSLAMLHSKPRAASRPALPTQPTPRLPSRVSASLTSSEECSE